MTEPTISKEKLFEELGYVPHSGQQLYHNSKARFKVPCCGRRWGKSFMIGHNMTAALFIPDTYYWLVAPTYSLGEKEFRVVFDDIFRKLKMGNHKGIRKSYNLEQGNMSIRMPWNSVLEVKSADKSDSLVGEGLDGVVLCEAALHKKDVWEMYIEPALLDKRGWADMPSTPRGHNWFEGMWLMGQDPTFDYVESWRFPTWTNTARFPLGLKDPVIQEIKRTRTEFHWQQEYCAEFTALEGKIYDEFKREIHVKDIQYNPFWRNFQVFDYGFCVDEETEILTKRGWLDYKDVLEGDECLAYNPDTDLAEWTEIQAMNTFDGPQEMEHHSSNTHDSLTTINHRWPTITRHGKFNFRETRELTQTDNHTTPVARRVSNLPTEPVHSDALVELAAWLWTEGQINPNGAISIWQNTGETADRIEKCVIEIFGEELSETRYGRKRAPAGWKHRDKHSYYTGNDLRQFYLNLNASDQIAFIHDNKCIRPEFISELTYEQLILFIDISMIADGSVSSSGSRVISQKKPELLHAFEMACSLAGFAPNSYVVKYGYDYGYGRGCTIRVPTNVRPGYGDKKELTITGRTWCPKTKYGTWLARRNGKVYFTGNSDPFVCLDVMVDPSDNVYVWREYQVKRKTNTEHSLILQRRENPEGFHVDGRFGDPRDPDATRTLNAILSGRPIISRVLPVTHGISEKLQGYDIVKQWMKIQSDGKPKLFFDRQCTETIRQIEQLQAPSEREGHNAKEGQREFDDHGADCVRYLFAELFILGYQRGDLASVYGAQTTEADSFFQYYSQLTRDAMPSGFGS